MAQVAGDDHERGQQRLDYIDVERQDVERDRQQGEVRQERQDVHQGETGKLPENRAVAAKHHVAVAKVCVRHGDGPRQQHDDEIVEVLAQQVLQERPDSIAEDRIPAADHEIEHLFPTAEVEPDRQAERSMAPEPVEVLLESVRRAGRAGLHLRHATRRCRIRSRLAPEIRASAALGTDQAAAGMPPEPARSTGPRRIVDIRATMGISNSGVLTRL